MRNVSNVILSILLSWKQQKHAATCYPVGVVWASCSFGYLISRMLITAEGSSYRIPSTAVCSAGWSLLSCSGCFQSWSSSLTDNEWSRWPRRMGRKKLLQLFTTDRCRHHKTEITERTGGWALKTRINWKCPWAKASHGTQGVACWGTWPHGLSQPEKGASGKGAMGACSVSKSTVTWENGLQAGLLPAPLPAQKHTVERSSGSPHVE